MSFSYTKWLMLCQEAAKTDVWFNKFRNHPRATHMVETVRAEMGVDVINEIVNNYPFLLSHMEAFATSDKVGEPMAYYYDQIDMKMAPTTLRYVKILGDLITEFGSLDDLNIVEIGVGYGGQCKIIHDFFKPKSYTLIDHQEVLDLSRRFLSRFDVNNVICKKFRGLEPAKYDLCISNYAFSEIDRKFQDYYIQRVINHSSKGYMACNIFGNGELTEPLSKEAMFALKENAKYIDEKPKSGPDNIIYIWK